MDPECRNTVFTQVYEGLKPQVKTEKPLDFRWPSHYEQWLAFVRVCPCPCPCPCLLLPLFFCPCLPLFVCPCLLLFVCLSVWHYKVFLGSCLSLYVSLYRSVNSLVLSLLGGSASFCRKASLIKAVVFAIRWPMLPMSSAPQIRSFHCHSHSL